MTSIELIQFKGLRVTLVREAPVWKLSGLFGHCPNSDCTPPLHSNGHSGALYFRTDLSKCHLNFNFHCISAPNHPGKGSDPLNQANAPLNMDNSSQNKCPKPFGQGSRPPRHLGNAQIDPTFFKLGLPLLSPWSASSVNPSSIQMTCTIWYWNALLNRPVDEWSSWWLVGDSLTV